MDIRRAWIALIVGTICMAGCAAAGTGTGRVAAPASTSVPPVIVGAGLPMAPAEPWLETPAVAASVVATPLRGLGCAGSVLVGGFFYGLFFPSDFSDDIKAWIGENCAGPYVVTPAEIARPGQPFTIKALRTPLMGTVPVEEAVRQAATPR